MYKLNREDYRKIKSLSKEEMERWLTRKNQMIYNTLRVEFERKFKEELQCSIDCFITGIAYTLHFSEETNLSPENLESFMDDMMVTIDYFRTGEYKPEEYEEELKKSGIKINTYDYDRIYKQRIRELEEQFNREHSTEDNSNTK